MFTIATFKAVHAASCRALITRIFRPWAFDGDFGCLFMYASCCEGLGYCLSRRSLAQSLSSVFPCPSKDRLFISFPGEKQKGRKVEMRWS